MWWEAVAVPEDVDSEEEFREQLRCAERGGEQAGGGGAESAKGCGGWVAAGNFGHLDRLTTE